MCPKPFNIHKPKEPVVPEPIRIESRISVVPVPESTYKNSLEKIEARSKARRQKIREEIEKKHGAFNSPNFTESKADVEAMREAKEKAELASLQYKFKAKPVRRLMSCRNVLRSWVVSGPTMLTLTLCLYIYIQLRDSVVMIVWFCVMTRRQSSPRPPQYALTRP